MELAGKDLKAKRLRIDSLVCQLADPGGPPFVILGLWGGILEGRRLAIDRLSGPDFEDDIVIAAAVASAQDAIITRITSDFTHSPIPVLTPAELLQRIQPTNSPPTANGPP